MLTASRTPPVNSAATNITRPTPCTGPTAAPRARRFSPMTSAILGSLVTTCVTFVPCFYWIFLGAPYVERLRTNQRLNASLSTITAAVVGVILNLAVWFAVHTLFGTVIEHEFGILRLLIPHWETLDPGAAGIAAVALWMTFWRKCSMPFTLAACSTLGMVLRIFL